MLGNEQLPTTRSSAAYAGYRHRFLSLQQQKPVDILTRTTAPRVNFASQPDVQLLLVVQEEQQEWSSNVDQEDPEPSHINEDQEDQEDPDPSHINEDQEDPDSSHIKEDQEDPEPPHIKEEQEELWTGQEGGQLQGLEEAGIKFSFTPVKSEDDEEEAQYSQLHQRLTEHIETEADGEDCGGPEPDRNSGPGDFSETEVSDVDWKETREPQSGLNSLNDNEVYVSGSTCSTGEKPLSCSKCGERFHLKEDLNKHKRIHTREKTFNCSVCDKRFKMKSQLKLHMRRHTGEKPFSCSECGKGFTVRRSLKRHTLTHTGKKPVSCSVCEKSFTNRGQVKRHMRIHT